MKILVTPTSFTRERSPAAWDKLSAFAAEIVCNPLGKPLAENEALPLLEGTDGWIAGLDNITSFVIENAPTSLKVISRYGVGYERVDLSAAAARGITVTNTPGVNSEAVADLALGLMLSVARRIPVLDRQVKAGGWPRTVGVELYGKTLGILGLGAIGKGVARRALGFSMRVLAYDPWMDKAYAERNGIVPMELDDLLACSDVISLHLPWTPQTANLLDAERISRLKPGVILINTARGGLMDEEALSAALEMGLIGGLGLDAFAMEPPGNSPLFRFDNVVATPHAGAHTAEAAANMAMLSVDNLIAVLTGKDCPFIVRDSCP
jgi:D-3-phosphoglycerate dehydrogenase